MSILVKGMKMPKNCRECIFLADGELCYAFESRPNARLDKDERPCWCPLIEIPEPHGRLIDADKLIELCNIMADKCDGIGESIWNQFATTVEWTPTIIPASEVEI